MNKRIRFISILLVLLYTLSFSITMYASASPRGLTTISANNETTEDTEGNLEFKSNLQQLGVYDPLGKGFNDEIIGDLKYALEKQNSGFSYELKEFLGREVTEDDIHDWSLVISSLRTDGFSNQSIAGILGNIKIEGGANQYAIEGYSGKKTVNGLTYAQFVEGGKYDYGDTKPDLHTNEEGKTIGGEGHGIVQWTKGRADNLDKFAGEGSFGYVTVTHWHKYFDTDMSRGTYRIPNMAGQVCFMVQELNTGFIGVKKLIKDSTSASDAAKIFHDEYEKSGTDTISKRQAAAEASLALVDACTGVVGSTSTSSKDSQELANMLVQKGIWGEDEFITFKGLTELPLEFPNRDDLSKDQLEGVLGWKNNIDYENEDGFIKYLRIFVMLSGILFLVWIVLIYLSYWFDRINNFVDIDLLPMITFGRLRVAPEENECTFNPKSFVKGQAQTVNHKVVISICLIGLFFAVLVISGKLYTLLNALVRKILSLLGLVY